VTVFLFTDLNMDENLPIDIHCNKLLGMVEILDFIVMCVVLL